MRIPHTRTLARTREIANLRLFPRAAAGGWLAGSAGVIWFLERETELIVCEIRRATDNDETFEFEVADAAGPKTQRFDSPRELISAYLTEQSRLMAQGWRPRNVATLE